MPDHKEKIYGHMRMAITETIRICIEKNLLKEYLERTQEVTDIMTAYMIRNGLEENMPKNMLKECSRKLSSENGTNQQP